ncbi:MAG TPA: hypothetical protein PLO93_05480 [Candidatus Omnitrophota bacterium]|nr:hypothetical protein [Candidatus Omnitrophota bacterium]HQL41725.1 hypothetical protein [Candidatus Omnitrophota bacterium]
MIDQKNPVKKKSKALGQTLIEFVVLFIVLVAAFLTMQKYIQRGVQGKWKETMDGMGKQYDPAGNMTLTSSMSTNAETTVNVLVQPGGLTTWRTDIMNMIEDKTEDIHLLP